MLQPQMRYPQKGTHQHIEKIVISILCCQNFASDLLQSIMYPVGPVEEELRRILMEMARFWLKTNNLWFQLHGCPEKHWISAEACLGEQS